MPLTMGGHSHLLDACLNSGGRLPKGYSAKQQPTKQTGYSRDKFGKRWADVDHDDENTPAFNETYEMENHRIWLGYLAKFDELVAKNDTIGIESLARQAEAHDREYPN